jgi:glutamyl-Q tRNA(Asp) synthetase
MAALASFLDTKARKGLWFVRMEDLDPPREVPGSADEILRTLEKMSLYWDGPVLYQSKRLAAYDAALDSLLDRGYLYHCSCTRMDLAGNEGRYPGTCRHRNLPAGPGLSLRCRTTNDLVCFPDDLQGNYCSSLESDTGDFIVRRKDGLHAYQLAVVVDDAWQGITHVMRGIDLLDSTPRQLYLQKLLGLPHPQYAHLPVLVNELGAKLSKQSLAPPVYADDPSRLLFRTLLYLQQAPDPALQFEAPVIILHWAVEHWHPEKLAGLASIPESSAFPVTGL